MEIVSILSSGLSVQDIADQLKVTQQTVRNWLKRGSGGVILRSYRVANKRRIIPSDLEEFLEQVTHEGFGHKEPVITHAVQSKGYLAAMKRLEKRFSKN